MKKIIQALYLTWSVALFVVMLIIAVVLLFISSIFPERIMYWLYFWILKTYARVFCFLVGIRPKIYFNGYLQENARVILPNHSSYFDPVALYLSQNRPFRTLARGDIAKIPIWGYLYKKVVIPVDRESWASRKNAFLEMAEDLKKTDIAVFPEGTFADGVLFSGDVKSGGFRLAQEGSADIYPMILLDSNKRLPEDFKKLSPGPCRIIFLYPISAHIVQSIEHHRLMKLYTDYMEVCLDFLTQNEILDLGNYSENWLSQNLHKYQ